MIHEANFTPDPYEVIKQAQKEGTGTWEMLVSAGIEASGRKAKSHWDIGDLATLVEKEYGNDAISKFAKDIKCPVGRVKEYRTVCRFWDRENSARADFLEELPNVYYSHYREAMKLKDMDKAVQFIEDCHLKDWTYEQACVELKKIMGKPVPPLKLIDTITLAAIQYNRVYFSPSSDDLRELFPYVDEHKKLRIVVYEVLDELPTEQADPNAGTGTDITPETDLVAEEVASGI